MKVCTKCKIKKDRGCFGKRTRASDGLFSSCKACCSEYAAQRYIKNKEHINKTNAAWRINNPEKNKLRNQIYKKNNREKIRESGRILYVKTKDIRKKTIHQWYENNKEKVTKKNAKWKSDNPAKAKIIRIKAAKKLRSTPWGKLNNNMSSGIGKSLRGNKAGRGWESLVGYTVRELKEHLEKQFTNDMFWDNYGSMWEIDHKIPKSLFRYKHPEDEDFKKAWSLNNLQPLPVSVNRKKYNKLEAVMNG